MPSFPPDPPRPQVSARFIFPGRWGSGRYRECEGCRTAQAPEEHRDAARREPAPWLGGEEKFGEFATPRIAAADDDGLERIPAGGGAGTRCLARLADQLARRAPSALERRVDHGFVRIARPLVSHRRRDLFRLFHHAQDVAAGDLGEVGVAPPASRQLGQQHGIGVDAA